MYSGYVPLKVMPEDYKFKLYGFMKRYFVLLSHFIVVEDFELFLTISYLLDVQLILEYLRIFYPICFALNEKKKVE